MGAAPLKLLVLGSGRMAARHIEAARRTGLVPVGATGRDSAAAAAREAALGVPVYADVDAAFAAAAPDLVVVATPTDTHLDMLERAHAHGVPALVEKPLCEWSVTDDGLGGEFSRARAVVAASVSLPHAVAHTELANPALQMLYALAAKGAVGRIEDVSAVLAGGGSGGAEDPTTPWSEAQRLRRLYDHAVHLVYLVERAFDRAPDALWPVHLNAVPGREALRAEMGFREAGARTAAGGYVSFDFGAPVPFQKSVKVLGTKGFVEWTLSEGREHLKLVLGRRGRPLRFAREAAGDALLRRFAAAVVRFRAGEAPEAALAAAGATGLAAGLRTAELSAALIAAHVERRAAAWAFVAAWPALSFAEIARGTTGFFTDERRAPFFEVLQHATWAALTWRDPAAHTFARLVERLRGLDRLAEEHLRWALSQIERHGDFDPDEVTRMSYAGAFSNIRILRFDNKCNQECLFCNVMTEAHDRMETDTTGAMRIVDRALASGERKFTFTGGEPTIRNDLKEVVRYARRRGAGNLDMQSNAIRCADKSYAYRLADAGLRTAMISFHSHIAKISDYLTHKPGTWEKTVQGIRNLSELGVTVRLNHVLTSANYKLLEAYLVWIDRTFPAVRDLDIMLNQHTGNGLNFPFLLPRLSEIRPVLARALPLAERLGLRVNNALTIPPCGFGGRPELTLEYQRLRAFEADGRSGDVFTHFLAREKVKGPRCGECVFDRFCLGVWKGYAELHGFGDLEPVRDRAALDTAAPDYTPAAVRSAG